MGENDAQQDSERYPKDVKRDICAIRDVLCSGISGKWNFSRESQSLFTIRSCGSVGGRKSPFGALMRVTGHHSNCGPAPTGTARLFPRESKGIRWAGD